MSKYAPLLEKLNELFTSGGDFPLEKCTPEEAAHFAEKVKTKMNVDLPQGYLDFLQEADGFVENGVFLYAMDQDDPDRQGLPSLLDQNAQWGLSAGAGTKWLFLGHSDLWLYAQSLETHQFHALYKDSVKSIKQFEDFDDMVTNMLKEALGMKMT